MIKQATGAAPIFEGAGRRWIIRHFAIGMTLAFGAAESYWHFYELPRRRHRDDYFKSIGTEWKKLI